MTKRAKKRIALLLVVLVGGAGALYAAVQVRKAQRVRVAHEKLASGQAAAKAGDYRTAVNDIGYVLYQGENAGLKVDPELWLEWVDCRRRVFEENGRHLADAIGGAKRAAELMPNDPRPLEILVELYGQTSKVGDRLDAANRLLKLKPDDADAMFARTYCLRALGRAEEARASAEAMAAAHPEAVRIQKARIQIMLDEDRPRDQINRDVRDYATAIAKRFPQNLRLQLLRCGVLAATGQLAEAREVAIEATKLSTDDPVALKEQLEVLDQLGLSKEAAAVAARQIDAAKPGSEMLVVAAERAWKAGQLDSAKQLIKKAETPLKSASDSLLGWWALVDQEGAKPGQPEHPALAELRRRVTPEAVAWTNTLDALAAMTAGDWAKARERLLAALANGPQDTMAQFLMGQVDRALGEPARAVERWRQIAMRESKWVRLNMDLSTTLLQLGRPQEAYDFAVRAILASPDQAAVAPTVARAAVALLESGDAAPGAQKSVLEFLESCRQNIGDAGELLALMARAYAAAGRPDEAKSLVNVIVEKKLNVGAESLRSLAGLSRRLGWGVEESLAASATARSDEDPAVAFALAMEARRAGKPAEGRKLLEDAAKAQKGPQRVQYDLRLAAYLDLIDDPDARPVFIKLARDNENDAQVQIALLQSRVVWSDDGAVSEAIGRLRRLAGEASSTWRLFEARRLLTFEPSEKNAGQAELLLNEVIKSDPQAVAARELAAEAALIGGERDAAIRYLQQAVDADPDQLRIYPRLITLLQQAGDTQNAERYLRQFGDRQDVSDDLRRRRAFLAQAQGMWDLAIADLSAVAAKGDPQDRLALARFLQSRGRRAEAERIYADLVANPDADLTALIAAADFYASTDRAEKGRELLSRVPDSPPGRRTALQAGFAERLGDVEGAEKLYTSLTQTTDKAQAAHAWNELARFYIRRRQIDRAAQAVKSGQAQGVADGELQETASALKLLQGERFDPAAASELLARIQLGEQGAAAKATMDAVAQHEKNPGDSDAYVAALERIIADTPSFLPAVQLLVDARLRAGAVEQALDAARSAARVMPTDPRPARMQALLLAQLGRTEQAIAAAEEWRDRALGDPLEAESMLADLSLQLNRPADALKLLEPRRDTIVADAEARPALVELLARALAAAGRENEAHTLLWERAQSDPDWARRYLRVGDELKAQPARARAWIERIAPKLTGSAEGQVMLGQAWYDIGILLSTPDDFRRAVESLAPALDDAKYGAYAAALTGGSLEQIGDIAGAEAMYRRAIKAQPDNAAAMNNLAYLLITSGGSADEALELASKAIALAPRMTTFLDTKGAALLKLGRAPEAEALFRKALAIDPADPTLLMGLADAQARQGRFPDAASTLDRVDLLTRTGRPLDPKAQDRLKSLRASVDEKRTPADK